MTYEAALEYVNSLMKFGMNPGLNRIKKLLFYLGDPQKKLKFIHVAGTNGKGSTCAFLSSVLTSSSLKTGLFISPFITDFRERIQINGNMIPKDTFAQLLDYIIPFVNNMQKNDEYITEFELITVVAFLWFAKEQCDVVVLETGLGGRLDATNVIENSLVSVITSISLDHTNVLGESLTQIAHEKAGILKPNGTLVLYPFQQQDVISVIQTAADNLENKIVIPDLNYLSDVSFNFQYTEFTYKGESFKIRLLGRHQIYNAITALTVIDELIKLGYCLPYNKIKLGLWSTKFPSRFEVLSENPLVILDGAHNPGGAATLSEAMDLYLDKLNIVAVVGMLKDKDVNEVLKIIAPKVSKLVITQPENPRAMDKHDLTALALTYNENCLTAKNIFDAIQIAFDNIGSNSAILVFGSLYLSSQIRTILKDLL